MCSRREKKKNCREEVYASGRSPRRCQLSRRRGSFAFQMASSKQLQRIRRGGELSSPAKLAASAPLSPAAEGKGSAGAALGLLPLRAPLAAVGLFARKQRKPQEKRRGGTERVNARVRQGSKFAVNWEAQTIVIPTLLSGFPRGLIQCQSLLRILRQSLFQAEFSS